PSRTPAATTNERRAPIARLPPAVASRKMPRMTYPPPANRPPATLNQLRAEKELIGTVERIVYSSEDGMFQVARFLARGEKDLVTIAGNLPGIIAGEPIHVHGDWKLHRQHGPTFEVESYIPILPEDPEMIRAYLGSGL